MKNFAARKSEPAELVPVSRFDVAEEVARMRATLATSHAARTLVRSSDLRILLVVLKRGATLTEHRTEGRLTIQGLDGRVRLSAGEAPFELASGQLVVLERDMLHAIEAIEDSSILITIAWHGHQAARP